MTRLHIKDFADFALDFEEISENYQGVAFRSLYIDLTPPQLKRVMEHLGIAASPTSPYHSLWMTHAQTPRHFYLIFSRCVGMDRDAIVYESHAQITTYNPHNMFKNKAYEATLFLYTSPFAKLEKDSKHNRAIFRIEKLEKL